MDMKRFGITFALIVVAVIFNCKATTLLVSTGGDGGAGYFRLKGKPVVFDPDDSEVVKNVADMLAGDLYEVTGCRPEVISGELSSATDAIVVGTLGLSSAVDSLAAAGVIPADSIRGGWERFIIKTVTTDGGCRLLVIAGSDRRGTAYGVTTLSQAIGVDPWVWWADVPVARCPEIGVRADYVSAAPSVKYRGMFINDEDWGLLPWAAAGLDSDIADIGPRTYEKVCRLLLRLKGNMLAPAMHSCTGAFYSHPESKVVADRYGIIITTSHCEPMLFNNAALSEWNPQTDGEWDYALNGEVIRKKFSARLEEAAPYENLYTVGMRGVHDEAMSRQRPKEERVALLDRVIADQRDMLSSKFGRPASEIGQIFVPYKETLDLYRNGLNLPDDVTIIWPDDNYGFMKSLSNPEERKRSGGAGVYYHTSYLGTPHDYLWLCTTPPMLMYHELRKAWLNGADRYWLLNVGDIKPAELDIQTFFDMAWNVDCLGYDNVNDHQPAMLARIFGDDLKNEFKAILSEYYRLAWIRKPEYMGWEIEWDSPDRADTGPTDFSFGNYGDAVKRIEDYAALSSRTRRIMDALPDSLWSPFFELVGYPVFASEMMTRKYLFAQLNGELAADGDKCGANYAARISEEACDSIDSLGRIFNRIEDGKWKGIMSVPPGFCAKYQNTPHLKRFPDAGERMVTFAPRGIAPGCRTLDLRKFKMGKGHGKCGARILEGIGYDGFALQLGEAADDAVEVEAEVSYRFDMTKGDSVTLRIFHLPFFPLYEGKRCRIGVSVDGGKEEVAEYLPEEWSKEWKINVLRNSAMTTLRLPLRKKGRRHELRLRGIDPGMVVQRIVIDEGGFSPGYVGPDLIIE